ncbi:hypothetical protein QYF36_013962 [Acer negundo]|nr:hypothetical protein QYF36_013962 [Acer negundo]
MNDHGCCHDLDRGGDDNSIGKAGHREEENEVDTPIGLGSKWLFTGLSVPSQELGCESPLKVGGPRFLEWRATREAGFTEQRPPPALGSGRIQAGATWVHYDPMGWIPIEPSLFFG